MNQCLHAMSALMIFAALMSCKENMEECNIGALGCQCTVGKTCDEGMTCRKSICVPTDPEESNEFKPAGLPCGGAEDPVTNLHWENPTTSKKMSLSDAIAHCAGYGGEWRLPAIEELRTLVSDACPAIAAEGIGEDDAICPITNTSTGADWNESCFSLKNGCEDVSAENNNCFFKQGFEGNCTSYFWSSSEENEDLTDSWVISFERGSIFHTRKMTDIKAKMFYVRCVCDPNPDLSTDTNMDSGETSATDSDS